MINIRQFFGRRIVCLFHIPVCGRNGPRFSWPRLAAFRYGPICFLTDRIACDIRPELVEGIPRDLAISYPADKRRGLAVHKYGDWGPSHSFVVSLGVSLFDGLPIKSTLGLIHKHLRLFTCQGGLPESIPRIGHGAFHPRGLDGIPMPM